MAYECQNFKNGQILTAECLNKIDEWLEYICGKEVVSGEINENGELVLTLCNGEKMNIGAVSSIHIGADAPTDGSKVWIDTDEEPEEEPEESGTKIDVVANVGQVIAVKAVGADSKPTEFEAVDLPKATAPNFAANEGEEGHIKNRTHYIDAKGVIHKIPNMYIDADWMATSEETGSDTVVIAEQKLTSMMWNNRQWDIIPGITYEVYINDTRYTCTAFELDGGVALGNNTSLDMNDYPFCIFWSGYGSSGFFYKDSTLSFPLTLKVTHAIITTYNKLPKEFLPDGVAMKDDIPEGGGTSIDVTAEVGQTIVVEEVDGNGKPTKWKAAEYQPRTHWSEETVVLPEITADMDFDLGGIFLNTIDFVSGADYAVVYNGTRYVCKCAVANSEAGSLVGIGYMDIFSDGDFPDADVPFVIATADFMGDGTLTTLCMPMGEDTTITVSVSKIEYTQIPDGYISKCLPFRFDCTTDGVTYTFTAKPAEVMAAVDAGRQVIMTYKYGNLMQFYLPLMSITGEEHTFAAGDKSFDLVVQADGTYAMKTQS